MVISCASVAVLGYVFNVVLAYAASDMEAILGSSLGQPLAAILELAMGNGVFTKFLWICTVLSNFGVVFVNNTAGTRVYFAYARDGALPFSKWLSTVNKTTNTPMNATLALSVVFALVGLISLGSTNALNAFFSGSSLAGATAYLTPILMRCVYEDNPAYVPGPFSLGRWSKPVRWIAVAWGCELNQALLLIRQPLTHKNSTDSSPVLVPVITTHQQEHIRLVCCLLSWTSEPHSSLVFSTCEEMVHGTGGTY